MRRVDIGRWVAVCLVMSLELQVRGTLRCERHEKSLNGQRCCQECGPGQGVIRACSINNDTVCQDCTFGESYSARYSHVQTCHPCSICPEYAHMTQPCNHTHDTMCLCDNNYFFDSVSQRCRPCRYCPMEYGVHRRCNLTHDTVCVRCPEGQYSDRLGMEHCRPCRSCGMNQVMLQHCSPGQDTICIDIPTMRSGSPMDPLTPSSPTGIAGSSTSQAIPLYCSLLAAVVAALLIYVSVKHYRRKKHPPKTPPGLTTSPSGENPPLLAGSPPGLPSPTGPPLQHGSDSGVYVEQEKSVTSNTRIRDLSAIKRKALENSLYGYHDSGGGWKALARELGFSGPMVSSVETRSYQEGLSPLRVLLSEWSKRDTAVVGTLAQSLMNIQRQDCVRILYGDHRDYVSAPNYIELCSTQAQII